MKSLLFFPALFAVEAPAASAESHLKVSKAIHELLIEDQEQMLGTANGMSVLV